MNKRNNISLMKLNSFLGLGIALVLLINGSTPCSGQEEISKEVRVVKAYNPTISDAFKARFIPVIDDTLQVETRFNYYIEPVKQPIQFRVKSLESISLRPEKSPELKHSYLRAGFGNYWTPMLEMDLNTTRNPQTSMGVNLSHISSQGKIKMDDEQKVYAGYADNQVKLYGSRIFRRSTLSADMHFKEDHYFLYGYNTDTLSDLSLVTPLDMRVLTKDSLPFQQYIVAGAAVRLKSDERTRNGFEYQLDLDYDFLHKQFRELSVENPELEHGAGIDFAFSHELKKITWGAETGGQYFYRVRSTDSLNNMLIKIDPWIGFNWEMVSLKAGPKIALDRFDSSPYFFPRVSMMVNITNTIVPYIGLDGYYENNDLMKIKGENPYLADDLDVEPTIHKFVAYGGLRGRFLPKAAFNLYIRWEDVKDWHFYVPELNNPRRNRFDVVYDDGSLLSMGGEAGFHPSENLGFILKGNYYKYDLDSLDYAWHKPVWDLNFTTMFSFREKISLHADLYLIGSQFVPSEDPVKFGPAQELEGLIDVNLGGEYRISKNMSAFGRINNLISDRYYVWHNYPVQGLNFLLGISWSF